MKHILIEKKECIPFGEGGAREVRKSLSAVADSRWEDQLLLSYSRLVLC